MRFSAAQTIEQFLPPPLTARMGPYARALDEMLTGSDEASQAKRASVVVFAIRISSAVIALVTQIALARLMGAFEYGIFVLVWVSMIVVGNLSCFGFQTAMIRFLPQYRERGDLDRLRGLLVSGRLVVLAAATFIAALTIAAVWLGSNWLQSYYVLPFMIGALTLPMIALGDTLDGTARANGWPVRAIAPTYIVRPILILSFLIGAWLLGFEINGVTGLVCAVIATWITTAAQLAVVAFSLRRRYPAGPRRTEFAVWLAVALPIFLVDGFIYLLFNADVLMVGLMMQPDDVAIYFATVKTLALVHFVYFAVKAGVAHRFSARIDDEDKTQLRVLARSTASWTFWPSLALGGVVLLLGPVLLGLFGADFTRGYPLLFILVAGVVVRAAVGPAESLLTMSGHHNICALVFGGVLVVNITANALLIPQWGLYGAATATVVAILVETLALFLVVKWRIGVTMFAFSGRRYEGAT